MKLLKFCLVLGVFLVPFHARCEDDPIKAKLDKAKLDYERALMSFRELAKSYFEKREDAARTLGSKKLVDEIKSERETFEKTGELPATAPATLRVRPTGALTVLTAAYTQVIKDYTRKKQDDLATAAENELLVLKGKANFPLIAGTWQEGPKENGVVVKVSQNGEKITATCTYSHKTSGEISWKMTGTISKEGEVKGSLVHTKAPRGWLNQTRSGKFSATEGTIAGRADFMGGSHDFEWKLIEK